MDDSCTKCECKQFSGYGEICEQCGHTRTEHLHGRPSPQQGPYPHPTPRPPTR